MELEYISSYISPVPDIIALVLYSNIFYDDT